MLQRIDGTRPTYGSTLCKAFKVFFNRLDVFTSFAAIAFVPWVLFVCCLVAVGGSTTSILDDDDSPQDVDDIYQDDDDSPRDSDDDIIIPPADQGWLMIAAAISFAVYFMTLEWGIAATVYATSEICDNREPQWRYCLQEGKRHICSLACTNFVLFAAMGLASTLVTLLSLVVQEDLLGALLMGCSIVVFICFYSYTTVVTACVVPAIVLKGVGPFRGLCLSVKAAKGRWWFICCCLVTVQVLELQVGALLLVVIANLMPTDFILAYEEYMVLSLLPLLVYVPLSTVLKTILYVTASHEGDEEDATANENINDSLTSKKQTRGLEAPLLADTAHDDEV
uniref:Uncharacterized protein n=1 Tax=Grammatophora oceanica TaxID=210454 RepID=A0A7S1YG97_9STRA|mmetsp:Transcript_44918/g.66684  ORF Transcript_44918/g.66684 Transcript_44918/m.66684 type:complete len:338 (+) Transcript_44918:150-1163(+)